MKNGLKGIVAGACLATSSLFFPLQTLAEKKVVFNEIYSVPMTYEYGEKTEETLNIQASVDQKTNNISFGIYTQNYNKYWVESSSNASLPISEQYTQINHTYSKILLLHPSRVKIEDQTQKIYRVPQHDWYLELQPYEKAQTFQLILETIKKAVDKITSKIPFLNNSYDKYLKDAEQKEAEENDKILEENNVPDYVITKIAPYIPNRLVGYTETAREYSIQFDIGNTQDEIPIYVWLRVALGDPSIAGPGVFPNRYGKLENIIIKFNLNENNVKRDELESYFLHGDDLKSINISKKNVNGTSSNPAIITIDNMGYEEKKPYEEDNVVRIGMAEYIIKGDEDSAERGLSLGVVQFKSAEDREIFMKRKESLLKYPIFFKESILSYIEEPTIEEVTSPLKNFSEQQYIIYGNLILDYSKRTGMEIILDKDPIRSQRLLKQIENYGK